MAEVTTISTRCLPLSVIYILYERNKPKSLTFFPNRKCKVLKNVLYVHEGLYCFRIGTSYMKKDKTFLYTSSFTCLSECPYIFLLSGCTFGSLSLSFPSLSIPSLLWTVCPFFSMIGYSQFQ